MKIISLSLSIIQADNRVIRQCSALSKAGYDVIAFGLAGKDVRQDEFSFTIKTVDINQPTPSVSVSQSSSATAQMIKSDPPTPNFKERLRLIRRSIILFLQEREFYSLVKILQSAMRAVSLGVFILFRFKSVMRYIRCLAGSADSWEDIYWRVPAFNYFLQEVEKEDFSDVKMVVANDWQMLPIAKFLADKYGVKFAYDSHEHALSENNHSLVHKYLMRGYLRQLEGANLKGASLVTSVSQGILDALQDQYKLKTSSFVVRSTPYYHEVKFRPVNPEQITIYFHGYLKENRHLDTILKSLSYLDERYQLLYRGGHYSSIDYEHRLLGLAKELGVEKRFKIVPIAMHDEMIELAKEADIGLSLPPLNSLHSDMALPNKFFEYVMAGLAIGVSDVKEMGEYTQKYDLGFVVTDLEPEKIAETIKAIPIDTLNRFRKNALIAAKELNWESEQNRFVQTLQTILEN